MYMSGGHPSDPVMGDGDSDQGGSSRGDGNCCNSRCVSRNSHEISGSLDVG